MPLYKRPGSPYLQIRFEIAGIEIRRSAGTTDRKAAQELEKKLYDDLWRQIKLGEKRHTWDDAVEKCKLEDQGQRSWDRKWRSIQILNEYLAGELLSAISYDSLLKLRQLLLLRDSKGHNWKTVRQWKPRTVNRVLAVLSAILNRCSSAEWKLLDQAPEVPMCEVEEVEPVWATREQIHALLGELPDHSRDMTIFACATGLRRSNVTHLEWSRVDLELQIAWVPASTAKGAQTIPVPLNEDAIEVLRAWEGRHTRYVFCFRKRAPIKQVTTKTWHEACRAAGLPAGFTFHKLRHTWASWHIQAGTPLKVLQELGAWTTIDMPMRYAHLGKSHLAQYANQTLLRAETGTVEEESPEARASDCSGGKGGTRTLDPGIMRPEVKRRA
jgi:integrase